MEKETLCLIICMGGDSKAWASSWQRCPTLFIFMSWLLPRRQHVSPPTNLRLILSICWLSHLPNCPAIGYTLNNINFHSTEMCQVMLITCWNVNHFWLNVVENPWLCLVSLCCGFQFYFLSCFIVKVLNLCVLSHFLLFFSLPPPRPCSFLVF